MKFQILLLILCIPPIIYRFRHPEMTETYLFLNLIESYREFFGLVRQ